MANKGNFSNQGKHTFNSTKHNIGVRLQQGVPILDRDWNEMEDIRRYFERMLRKWYIGNGVPKDNNGFKIVAPPDKRDNDFLIKAGRCMVNGYDVENEKDTYYSAHVSSNAELLTIPTANRKFLVYLEVWTDSVDSTDDQSLKNNQDINIETCIRDRLFWKVGIKPWLTLWSPPIFLPSIVIDRIFTKVAPATGLRKLASLMSVSSAALIAPIITSSYISLTWDKIDSGQVPSVEDIEEITAPEVEAYEREGHSFYPLAFIARKANESKITDDMILDLRQTNLNLSHLTRRIENLESEIFLWDVTMTPKENKAFYGSPVDIEVEVKDAHGPRKGACVEFSTDFGFISPLNAVTDEFGKAKATLVGSVVDEFPEEPAELIKEIIELKEIHQNIKSAFDAANPDIKSFVSGIKFSSAQMSLIAKHIPGYITREPIIDVSVLAREVTKIPTKTATVNVHVKYSSNRQITKGLGSTQVVFRQWVRPWLTHNIHSVFNSIQKTHIEKVAGIVKEQWDDTTHKLKADFTPKLTTHMDEIQSNVKEALVKKMIIEETTPSLGILGELVHGTLINMIEQDTVSAVKDTIGEKTGVIDAVNESLVSSNRIVSLQKVKANMEYRKKLEVWPTRISGPS